MNRTRLCAFAALTALTVAACGGSDDSQSSSSTQAATGDTTSGDATTEDTEPDAGASTDDPSGESTTDESTTDESTTDGAEASSGGYEIDASACDPEASEPLADGEPLKIGITLTMTGPGAAPQLSEGMVAYFEKINAEGGVDGHLIETTVADDAFDAARSVANITQFIQSDGIFALGAQQGSANIVAAQPVIEEACMPQFFVPAGLPAFGDPVNHPWTSTSQMAYDTEAQLWAQFLDENHPEGAKVGLLVFNSAFGTDYVDSLTEALEGSPHEIVEVKLHEATAVNVDNEVTALVAAGPDVIFGATAGAACTQMMTATSNSGFEGDQVISALCLGIDSFFTPAGAAADGVMQIQSFKDPSDPVFADDADIQAYMADIEQYGADGVDPLNGFVAAGYRNAALLVHTLNEAAASSEGLTRVSVANAAWNIDVAPALAQPGIMFTMSGDSDAYPIESGTLFEFDADGKTMVDTGLTLSAEGESGTFGG